MGDKYLKLVYVEWLDHASFTESTWREADEYEDLNPATCKTIGWILRETEDMIILVQTIHYSDEFEDKYCGEMGILKGAITLMKEIEQ